MAEEYEGERQGDNCVGEGEAIIWVSTQLVILGIYPASYTQQCIILYRALQYFRK